jgi:hypothetical protein
MPTAPTSATRHTTPSARFDQEGLEDAKLSHGLFAFAVAESLNGKGRPAEKREITTKGLADYVIKRVGALAKDIQANRSRSQL